MIKSKYLLPFLNQLEKGVLVCLIFTMTVIVFIGVITRYLFGFSFYWIEEIPRYCLVWVTFLGAVSLMKKGVDHPRVLKFLSQLPNSVQKFTLIGENILMILIMGVICTGAVIIIKIHYAQVSPAMELPMYIIYSIIPLSAFIGVIRLALNAYDIAKGKIVSESRFE